MSWFYHASLDPYNTTELMDWTWSNLALDWTNGRCLVLGQNVVFLFITFVVSIQKKLDV